MLLRAIFICCLLLGGLSGVVRSAEDDIIVESPEESETIKGDNVQFAADTGKESVTGEEGSPLAVTSSPDADTTVLFTFPTTPKEIPTNKPIRLLVGFRNKGESTFVVDYLEASLRYPMDYSYIITNFTAIRFSRPVPAHQEATFDYGFFLSDAFAARPFTLSINLHYHDIVGENIPGDKGFSNAIFNETIQVIEPDEGLDSQTFFLYVMFAAIVALLGLLGNHYFKNVFTKKRPTKKATSQVIESGTSKSNDVDYDWLPESTLRNINKSPKKSPTQSRSPQLSPRAKKRL